MSETPKPARRTRLSAIIASVALAAVTLGTFCVLREVGPESTLRKFHRLSANHDYRGAMNLSIHSTPDEVRQLGSFVAAIAERGGQFLINGTLRQGKNVVVIEAKYYLPNSQASPPYYWFIEREDEHAPWRVNADRTLLALLQPFRRPL